MIEINFDVNDIDLKLSSGTGTLTFKDTVGFLEHFENWQLIDYLEDETRNYKVLTADEYDEFLEIKETLKELNETRRRTYGRSF